MEGPEKIFICDYGSELGFEWHSESDWEHQGSNDIEYTRTDALIEKACKFLKSYRQDTFDGCGYIAGIVNDKTIEDFKKYMEG